MGRAVPPLPQYAFMAWWSGGAQGQLYYDLLCLLYNTHITDKLCQKLVCICKMGNAESQAHLETLVYLEFSKRSRLEWDWKPRWAYGHLRLILCGHHVLLWWYFLRTLFTVMIKDVWLPRLALQTKETNIWTGSPWSAADLYHLQDITKSEDLCDIS
jgi:hypothetical protein